MMDAPIDWLPHLFGIPGDPSAAAVGGTALKRSCASTMRPYRSCRSPVRCRLESVGVLKCAESVMVLIAIGSMVLEDLYHFIPTIIGIIL